MKRNGHLKVFLADLGHTYFNISPSTIPIGISYIKAMLKAKFGGNIDVSTFRYPDALLSRLKEEKPDMVGFGIYAWNENLSLWFAKVVRKMYPEVLIVAGGLNVPVEGEEIQTYYIDRHKGLIDVYIPHEGELPMVRLLERIMGATSRHDIFSKPVSGCHICRENELLIGDRLPFIENIEDIPSPYLTGAVDEFLSDPMLMPVIQTMRGCPYRCVYCVSGEKVYSKIRTFSLERAKDEILYIKQRAKNRGLRFTDDNFGLFERDEELAEFIGKLYSEDKYPNVLKVYTAKATNDRVRRVMLCLKDLIPYNVSLQSTTPEVLKNINRNNPPLEDIAEAFRWAKENDIITGTEILHGFPGETYETFAKCVNAVYELRVDSVGCHEVWLLPNTEFSSKQSRAKHKFDSRFILGADGLSVIEGELVCECEEHIISSGYMTEEEHYKLCALDLYIAISLGYLRELAYHGFTYEIHPVEIFNEILSSSEKYPALNNLFYEYIEKVKSVYFISAKEVYNYVKAIIDSNRPFPPTRFKRVLMGEFVFGNTFLAGLDEYIAAMSELCERKDPNLTEEFIAACDELKKLSVNMVINPEKIEDEHIYMQSNYDIPRWIGGCYRDRINNYRCDPIKIRLSLPSVLHHRDIYEKGKKLRDSLERIQFFFRNTNSSGMRRRVGCDDK